MYRLNDEQQRVVAEATAVAVANVAPEAARVDREGAFPEASIAALAQCGLLGLNVPSEFGGRGQGLRTIAAVLEVVGRHCSSTAMVYLMHLCGVACYATAPQKTETQLRAASQGTHLSTLAFSETGSRSHFWAPVSRASRNSSGAILNCDKSFVTSANRADYYVVSSGAIDGSTAVDSTLYLVEKNSAGVEWSGSWNGTGLRGNASGPMTITSLSASDPSATRCRNSRKSTRDSPKRSFATLAHCRRRRTERRRGRTRPCTPPARPPGPAAGTGTGTPAPKGG